MRILLFVLCVLGVSSSAFAQADPLELIPLISHDEFSEMQVVFLEWIAPPIIGVMLGLLALSGVWAVFSRLKGVVGGVGGMSAEDRMWADTFDSDAEYHEFMASGKTLGEWEAANLPSGFVGGGAGWGAPSASDREDYERAMRERDDF